MKKFTLDEVLKKRRSVRVYENKMVEKDKLISVVESSMFAPSACNRQPARFIVVTDKGKVEKIIKHSLGGIVSNRWATTVPVFIIACAKRTMFVHTIAARFKNIPYHYLDMGAAIEHLLLKAVEQGLAACWIGWFNRNSIRRILHIPASIEIISLIAIGYESKQIEGKERVKRMRNEFLFWNEYGKTSNAV
ncbi:MAG: hypothetical protein E3J78_00455 [Candidatus Cloacimonadota bacterium]|nr:MAG: hypothetical protein E3J78_00455 [Candidatus Cloacimonadota bacterium]